MPEITVTISIVSYNSQKVLKKCLESVIESARDIDIEIIVVDNCSEDGSAELVKEHFPAVTLVENKENVGFGKAHNQSFRLSRGKYFLILNPDTVLEPGTIRTMVKFMDSNNRAGVAGCKTFWDDEKRFMFPDLRIHTLKTALLQFTPFCRLFPDSRLSQWYWRSAHRLWNAKMPIAVEGITGGFMMVRREAFESAGAFDEHFFLFFEEHDLLRRIKKQGWEIYYVPHAAILHYYEESFRNSLVDIGAVYRQSAFYYYRKHYTIFGYFFIHWLLFVSKFVLSLESTIVREKETYRKVYPVDGRLTVTWSPRKGALKYLVEVSYWPTFCDRAGMYADGEKLSLEDEILDRLPNETGFLRITPVYDDSLTGKVIEVIKISNQPESIP